MKILSSIKIKAKKGIEGAVSDTSEHSDSSGVPGVNKSEKLTLSDGKQYLWKPASGEHVTKWRYIPAHTLYKRERAAYLTSQQLEWNLVPQVRIMKVRDEIGSLQNWVSGTSAADKTLAVYSQSSILKAGLFDIIIGNSDRHSGNWLTTADTPILIDHGDSFPNYAASGDNKSIIISRFAYQIWEKAIPETLLNGIRKLQDHDFQEHLRVLIGNEAIILFNERVNCLLSEKIARCPKYQVIKKKTEEQMK